MKPNHLLTRFAHFQTLNLSASAEPALLVPTKHPAPNLKPQATWTQGLDSLPAPGENLIAGLEVGHGVDSDIKPEYLRGSAGFLH